MRRFAAVFCIGIITGAVIMNLVSGHEIDRLHLEKKELQVQLYDISLQVEKLLSQLSDEQPAVQSIDIVISNKEQFSPFIIVAIKQEIHKLTQDLIGQNLDTINPHLISRLLDNRVVTAEEKFFRLSIQLIIVGEKTVVETDIILLEEKLEDEP